MKPIIFLRTAWMIDYKGVTEIDEPTGAGSYVADNKDGMEVANFFPVGSKYYGFARIRKGNNLRIERLGAKKSDEVIDDVTVVFFAKNPHLGGQFVVGWYDKAKLYRSCQTLNQNQRLKHPWYLATTNLENGTLLNIPQRSFEIPEDGPGQTNAWYVMEYYNAKEYLKEFFQFKASPNKYLGNFKLTGGKGSGWQMDAEIRKQVEIAAMDATEEYFKAMGYDVEYVHQKKFGWDLEAKKENQKLLLEVKGLSASLGSVILTPNEYQKSLKQKGFLLCILENALDKKNSKLHICKIDAKNKFWISNNGEKLKIVKITSAQIVKTNP